MTSTRPATLTCGALIALLIAWVGCWAIATSSFAATTMRQSCHNRLSAGRYRLTVKPLAGRPRSIYLSAQR